MENLLSALAFAGLIAAQFLSVVLVNTQRCEDPSPGTRNRIARASACGSLAHSARRRLTCCPLLTANGLDITYVPYRGLAPSISDLVTARTHMAFDALTTLLPLIKEGKLRPLAVLSKARLPELPDVPTMTESGYPDFPTNPWTGIVAVPGTSQLIVRRLNETINVATCVPRGQAVDVGAVSRYLGRLSRDICQKDRDGYARLGRNRPPVRCESAVV